MKTFLRIFIPIFWAGLIAAISFLEAPLKFQAPGITIPLGLGIGQLVFQALNKIEVFLFLGLIFATYQQPLKGKNGYTFLVVATMLLLETFWLLPFLDAKAKLVLAGMPRVETYHHYLYIAFDVIKFFGLITLGYLNFKVAQHEIRHQK